MFAIVWDLNDSLICKLTLVDVALAIQSIEENKQ